MSSCSSVYFYFLLSPVTSHDEGSPMGKEVKLRWEWFVEKAGFVPRVKKWRSDGWWEGDGDKDGCPLHVEFVGSSRRQNERPVGRAQRDTGVLGLADIC